MNTNKEYWSSFYAKSNEVPLEPSNFAVFVLKFLQDSPEKKSHKNILSIGCGNGRDAFFFVTRLQSHWN